MGALKGPGFSLAVCASQNRELQPLRKPGCCSAECIFETRFNLNQSLSVLAGGFTIAGLGFVLTPLAFAGGTLASGADCASFLPSGGAAPVGVFTAFVCGGGTTVFDAPGFGEAALRALAVVFFAFGFAAGFFAAAAFGSSFFGDSSKTGLGIAGPTRETSAAGLTPAAVADFAAAALNTAAFGVPCMSGFTMTWLS